MTLKSTVSFLMIIFSIMLITCTKISDIDNCTDEPCNTYSLDSTALIIYDKLMEAYNESCTSCLEQILLDWKSVSIPDSDIPDSLKFIYDVYKEFYSPWNLARISDSEFGDYIYEGVSYYIIQNILRYDYNLTPGTYGNYYTIKPFQPEITNDTINVLYLKNEYMLALNFFLGSNPLIGGSYDYMLPDLSVGEINDRYSFLHNYLLFFHGHWGNYWHLETHPEVSNISFNYSRDSALVFFRLGYQGGEVTLSKVNYEWVIVEHRMTWVE